MQKTWHIRQPDPESIKRLSHILNCHTITATVLINRQIDSEKKATEFLNVSLNNIRSPFSLKDMDAAVHRIYAAIENNEKILIFGDYDVDGVTATALLLDFFRYIDANVSYYIPHRLREGYGLQLSHITNLAQPNKIDLIITADCGSGNHEAAAKARNSGIDLIISDHHNIPANIPPATAVINPKRQDCTAGLDHFAGVGVAFLLLICLRKFLRDMQFWHDRPEPNLKNLCDLVALGTIADIVPLVHENRIFSKIGLELINANGRLGINALLEAAGISKRKADADDIAFRLAPRLNAAGRMEHASTAVDLLTTTNSDHARQIAETLNAFNQKRQDSEKKIMDDILTRLAKNPELLEKRTLVLWNHQWHQGVLGIVASRMVEKFYRPVVLLGIKDQLCKGSARSIPEIDLYERLLECKDVLENFGGHSMAAGLSLPIENLKPFHRQFDEAVDQHIKPDAMVPQMYIDVELEFTDISEQLIDELESLAPFGAGNPEPIFMARNVSVAFSKIVGNNHRRMILKQTINSASKTVNAIHFNVDTGLPLADSFDRIAFKLRWNRWSGSKTAQLVIEEIGL
jgi:single-stranded-DNA-specific exonuclease